MANPGLITGVAPDWLRCETIKVNGERCAAPRLNGKQHCRMHYPKMLEAKIIPAAEAENHFDLNLNSYEDIVRWNRDLLLQVRRGQMKHGDAEMLSKLLTRLSEAMLTRDKSDPDKESKRQFSIEAAVQAAKKLTGEQAAAILRAGTTNFMDFLNNPVTIDVTPSNPEPEEVQEAKPKQITATPQKPAPDLEKLRESIFGLPERAKTKDELEHEKRIEELRKKIQRVAAGLPEGETDGQEAHKTNAKKSRKFPTSDRENSGSNFEF